MREGHLRTWNGYILAVISVASALTLVVVFRRLENPGVFPLFLGAVLLSAWYGGSGPGLVAILCSAASGALLLSSRAHSPEVALRAAIFVGVALPTWLLGVAASRRATAVTSRGNSGHSPMEERLLRLVSEELRGPLDPLILVSEMLRREPFVPPAVRRELQTIREKIDVESRLLDDLSELAEASSGRLGFRKVRLNLHEPLCEAVQACEGELRERQVELRVDFTAPDSCVLGNVERLEQLFWNLIRTALRFAPYGGTIHVRTASEPNGRVRVDVSGERVELDPAQVAAMFRPLDNGAARLDARFGSLGLGLAVSQTLTEAHGGSMWAEGLPGGSTTTFHVSFPNAPPQPGNDNRESGNGRAMKCSS